MTNLDWIVVAMLPRTGSSLALQTLSCLGRPVFGQPDRKDSVGARRHNPKGYFEHPELIRQGIAPSLASALGDQLAGAAFKIGLSALVENEDRSQWRLLRDNARAVIVTIRHPAELFESYHRMVRPDISVVDRFMSTTDLMRSYRADYIRLARILTDEFPDIAGRFTLLSFHEAFQSAADYVETIARAAALGVAPEQRMSAIANIDPRLHRNRLTDGMHEEAAWAQKMGAQRVFEAADAVDGSLASWKRLADLSLHAGA